MASCILAHYFETKLPKELILRTRPIIQLLAVLAFSAFALAACKQAANTNNTNNSNNSNTTSNTTVNKNTSPPASTGDYSTPTAAFKTFYEAAKAGDVEGLKRSFSKKTMEEVTKDAAKSNKTVDESLKEISKDTPAGLPEIRNEKIEGDKASAEMKDDKMDKWIKVYFVKEDGKWKIALDEEKSAGMDNMDHGDMDKK